MINHGDEKGLGHFSDPAETSADVLKDAERCWKMLKASHPRRQDGRDGLLHIFRRNSGNESENGLDEAWRHLKFRNSAGAAVLGTCDIEHVSNVSTWRYPTAMGNPWKSYQSEAGKLSMTMILSLGFCLPADIHKVNFRLQSGAPCVEEDVCFFDKILRSMKEQWMIFQYSIALPSKTFFQAFLPCNPMFACWLNQHQFHAIRPHGFAPVRLTPPIWLKPKSKIQQTINESLEAHEKTWCFLGSSQT